MIVLLIEEVFFKTAFGAYLDSNVKGYIGNAKAILQKLLDKMAGAEKNHLNKFAGRFFDLVGNKLKTDQDKSSLREAIDSVINAKLSSLTSSVDSITDAPSDTQLDFKTQNAVTTYDDDSSITDFLKKAINSNPNYEAAQSPEDSSNILPNLKTTMRYYAENGELPKGGLTVVIDHHRKEQPQIYGKHHFAWVTAGIPISDANNTPNAESAAKRCVQKIAETDLLDKDGNPKLVDGKSIKLGLIFEKKWDYNAIYAEIRSDKLGSIELQKMFCGAIFGRAGE